MTLSELIEGLPVWVTNTPDPAAVRICDITEDSRTALPGSLFVARVGLKADGRAFVADAAAAGAVAILTDDETLAAPAGRSLAVVRCDDARLAAALMAERFFGNASRGLGLVGVTGTNGKSTITFLVWKMMNGVGRRAGLVGTVIVDDGREVAAASMTTPPAIELSRILASIVEAGGEAAALEVSSHSLDQHRAGALRFRAAVFTNLTGDHLDYHKTMEAYADAKARLFGLVEDGGWAIVNGQDAAAERMVRGFGGRVMWCEIGVGGPERGPKGLDVALVDRCLAVVGEQTIEGTELTLTGPWGTVQARTPLIGAYNAMNVLQAVASCHALGLDVGEIERGLAKIEAPPGRLERVSTAGDDLSVFVDYAHSDDSLRSVLFAVGAVMEGRAHAGGRVRTVAGSVAGRGVEPKLWAVFGCGGDKDRTKRPRMGHAAAELADRVVVTSDNPRTERPSAIIDEVLSGIPESDRARVVIQADRARAIRHAIAEAEPGDVVVIAGKGHETEQILPDGAGGTLKVQFDDREVARAALAERCAARPKAEGAGPEQGVQMAGGGNRLTIKKTARA